MAACRRPGGLTKGSTAGQQSRADQNQGLWAQYYPSKVLDLGAAPTAGSKEHVPLFPVQDPTFFSHGEGRTT